MGVDTQNDGGTLTAILNQYRKSNPRRSTMQLLTTALPFVALWGTMLYSLRFGYWVTLLLAVPTAGFMIRLFMIQHDCGHGAFFASQRVNNVIGAIIGVVTFVPYTYWRKTHAIHHKTSGDLDLRGFGDINTLTVREYLALSRLKRFGYRLYRHPIVMLGLGPTFQFLIKHRFPADLPWSWKREWASIWWNNLALAAVLLISWPTIGLPAFLKVEVPIFLLASSTGVWLFYVQHQFEDTYWREHPEWDFFRAGLHGSSYYDLPKVLRWFTADIGLHHIHHISSKIPNYRLRECFRNHPELRHVTRLTLRKSLKSLRMALWDEERERLVSFGQLRSLKA